MHYVDVYLEADNGKIVEEFDSQHKLSPFPFAPAANFLTVTIPAMLVDPCVWDPGIRFKFRALTIPMERFGGMRVSNSIYRCVKVNILVVIKGLDSKEEWNKKGIATTTHLTLLNFFAMLFPR
ncbi:hypothetical protein KY290_015360 [Solanum tuberosum]|uniref:Uncharacterized protein n=1 Tax=Solanum tuberosum TaxID=4113 RepID=A0ABQ7VSC6_SOLTU|nr:hypothetical protein KY285_014738 [Solanum tuberosum]KAH0771379.1 hypothetical protein KY290_015360 [Solanum tuberosum]